MKFIHCYGRKWLLILVLATNKMWFVTNKEHIILLFDRTKYINNALNIDGLVILDAN